jgi:hypothetical protein
MKRIPVLPPLSAKKNDRDSDKAVHRRGEGVAAGIAALSLEEITKRSEISNEVHDYKSQNFPERNAGRIIASGQSVSVLRSCELFDPRTLAAIFIPLTTVANAISQDKGNNARRAFLPDPDDGCISGLRK